MVALHRLWCRFLLAAAVIFCLLMGWGFNQPATFAASHREAPLIAGDPLADNTDVYAFRSYEPGRENYVTLLWNHIPGELPSAGPQYYPFGNDILYDIKIDNTGDGSDDVIYRFTFQPQIINKDSILGMTAPNQDLTINSLNDPDYNQRQTYTVTRFRRNMLGRMTRKVIGQGLVVPPNNIGTRATPNYENLAAQAIYTLPTGERVFAGQRDEGFYLALGPIFDNLNIASPVGDTGNADSLAGLNVNTLAIEVPIKDLTRNHNQPTDPNDQKSVIGVYSTASRCATKITKGWCEKPVQVSRLANPLFNELIVPLGMKDKYNATEPENDQQFGGFVRDPQLAQILKTLYGISLPPAPRGDLVAILTTGIPSGLVPGYSTQLSDGKDHDLLRLNVAISPTPFNQQSRLGILGGDLAGYPNGRRVNDDVVDISLRAVAGGTPFTPATNISPNNVLSDRVSQNDVPYLNRFPYLGTPASGDPAA